MNPLTQNEMNGRFWGALDELVQSKDIVIDRPAGTAHPRDSDFVYPIDYGYLDGTSAMDGGGIDVWVGTLGSRRVTGVVTTVDLHKSDAEIKILVGCTLQEMETIESMHNRRSQSGLLTIREA